MHTETTEPMKEKLEQYAFIAQIVSAGAIVLSLIFVGLQVRMGAQETAANSLAVRSAVQQAMMETDKDLLLFRALNKDLDQNAMFDFANAMFRSRELYWAQHEAGLMSDESYYSYMYPLISGLSNNPMMKLPWVQAVNNSRRPPGFIAEVDRLYLEWVGEPIDYSPGLPELNAAGND